MTLSTGQGAVAAQRRRPRLTRPRFTRPHQGWSSFVLLLVMLAATGYAVDGSRWMGIRSDGTSPTTMLPLLMVMAGVVGSCLSWSRLGQGLVDLCAAVAGTAAGLLLAAGAVSSDPSITERLAALNASLSRFLSDVVLEGVQSQEPSAFLLVVSALAWTSGVYAAISIFRRSNPSGAIVSVGAILILDILVTRQPQDLWLVVFAGAALLLVLRLDLEAQRDRWIRRRMVGGQGVGGLFLRGGGVIVAGMIGVSVLLTGVVNARSVATAFPQLGSFVDDLAVRVQDLVHAPGTSRTGSNGRFPPERTISDSWSTSAEPVFTVATDGAHYWRGSAYDTFDGRTWSQTERTGQEVPAFDDLLGTSVDAVDDGVGRVEVTARITSQSLDGDWLPAAQDPSTLSIDGRVSFLGHGGRDAEHGPFQYLAAASTLPVGASYTVESWEPVTQPGVGVPPLTVSELLQHRDEPYPDWLRPFLRNGPGVVGANTKDAVRLIRRQASGSDAYHLAEATQRYLTGGDFQYVVDLAGRCRSQESWPECLLRIHMGFCQQYATTMVVILREMGVPARYVEGWLPGTVLPDGSWEVDSSAAHAWVEVWFNGVGWIPFDPTPGGTALGDLGQTPTRLDEGEPLESFDPNATPGPDATDPLATDDPFGTAEPTESPSPPPDVAATTDDAGLPPGWLLVIAGLVGVALAVSTGGWLWFRRYPGHEPDLVWRGVVGLATRLGSGPRPSQTPYEYTVTLSAVVPRVARDLRTVADAKVDATYAGPRAHPGARNALRDAYRRTRSGLLRLLFRRR